MNASVTYTAATQYVPSDTWAVVNWKVSPSAMLCVSLI